MAYYGLELMKRRRRQVEELTPYFERSFRDIMDFEGPLELRYRTTLSALTNETVDDFVELLGSTRGSDRQRGFTQRGPHTDDFVFKMSDHSAKSFASQGQQRALVLATKISEILYFKKKKEEWPVLLLDDVSSELAPTKNQKLFQFLNDFSGQVFITTTDENVLNIDHDYHLWRVNDGTITPGEKT